VHLRVETGKVLTGNNAAPLGMTPNIAATFHKGIHYIAPLVNKSIDKWTIAEAISYTHKNGVF